MPIRTYNNNENSLTVNVYSPIKFSNPESKVMQTKLSISYFNKLMKISIAPKINEPNATNKEYATYDDENQISIFVSYMKAELLSQMITKLNSNSDIHNVCVEINNTSKNALLKVSDGSEYNTNNPCISIICADKNGNMTEYIYEVKSHNAAYNYNNGKYTSEEFNDIELSTFQMCLDEYYKASSYAVAATVTEANMYHRDLIYRIADKVGAKPNGGSKNKFSNTTFLSANGATNNNTNNGSGLNGEVPHGYEASTFDSVVANMM